jgi:hypothetical protein
MPITAYTPEQLGFGASKAESLKNPEPNNDWWTRARRFQPKPWHRNSVAW